MKKPKPRHLKKEIAKQVLAIQKRLGLTKRQMRLAVQLVGDFAYNPAESFVGKRVLHFDSTLTSAKEWGTSPARQEMFARHQEQQERVMTGRVKPIRNMGEVEGIGPHLDLDPSVVRELLDASLPANVGVIIDRTSHPVVNRPNPLREHWERFGDPYEGRIPACDIDHTLLAIKPTPEMKELMAKVKDRLKPIFVDGVRVDNPEEDKE
ncbi:hypothetical protein D3C85_636690 [compost metagenome]